MDKNKTVLEVIKGVKMHSAGEKMKKSTAMKECEGPKMDDISYPSLYLNIEQVPELKDFEVDDKVSFVINGCVTSHSLNENGKNKRETFDIKVERIAVISTKK